LHTNQQTRSSDTSTPTSISTNDNQIIPSPTLNIIPVPSFLLRSTAVCTSQDDHLLSERTPSIHTDISIFKYRLTQKETKLPVKDFRFISYPFNLKL
jgi:hypothetical protein